MDLSRLSQLNEKGFLPGPQESEAAFLERVERTVYFFKQKEREWIPLPHWNWVEFHLKEVFSFYPSYLPAFYSNQSLAPWQGAACWIEGRQVKAIQLREGLKKGTYLGLYSRDEILAHESVHAARSAFEESQFEEFFAFMTSPQKWRRVLGPLIQRPWEIWPFLIAMMSGAIFQLLSVFSAMWSSLSAIGYLGASLWTALGFCRLIRCHSILRRCGKEISKIVKDARKTRAILLRLTDAEIQKFAKFGQVKAYADLQKCLRWQLIRFDYFPKSDKISN